MAPVSINKEESQTRAKKHRNEQRARIQIDYIITPDGKSAKRCLVPATPYNLASVLIAASRSATDLSRLWKVRAFLSSQIFQTTSRSRERVPFFGTADEPTMNQHCLIEEE